MTKTNALFLAFLWGKSCNRAVVPGTMRLASHQKGLLASLLVTAASFLSPFCSSFAADKNVPDANVSVIVNAEGRVEVMAPGASNWVPAQVGQKLEIGYRLRTGAKSKAMVRLSNLSLLPVGDLTEYELEPPRNTTAKATLNLKTGMVYFFSRSRPRELDVRTRTATGGIRGTEFNLAVAEDGKTTLTMIDGIVDFATPEGSLVLTNGDQAVAEVGKRPVKTAVLNAVNIIQWNLYYPGVLDLRELKLTEEERSALASSITAYQSGDLLRALNNYPAGRNPSSPAEKIYFGQLLLAVGLVEQTEAQLESIANEQDENERLARALRQLIASVKLLEWDDGAEPKLATEWLAESYYRQSHGELSAALEAARKASEISPSFGFASERVAELEFSFGRTGKAHDALNKSLAVSPRNAQGVALKGFLLSAENHTKEALKYFDEAIALDGALGNAWLGRGLCHFRRGELDAGLEDLQVAASLEPNRAVLRSYLGKAFTEVGDDVRAEHELALARRFDPNDPTSWLYSALLHQQENRINEAVRDMEQSELVNENRRVYRSRLLLDQDAAVRGANLASIYRDAGMTEVSVREATRAVNSDYANYSAHLFLANSYNELRDPNQINLRYETPWLSEFLIANLLAPVGAGTLSQTVSQQEYSKFFERDRFGLASSTEYFSKGAWLQEGAVYANSGNSGFAFDETYRSDNGWRPNNSQEQLTLSLQLKQQLTPQDILFLQGIYYDASAGDLTQYYQQSQAHQGLSTTETQKPLLLAGYDHEWFPGMHTLVLGGRFQDTYKLTDTNLTVLHFLNDTNGHLIAIPVPTFPTADEAYRTDLEIYSVELQQIWKFGDNTLEAGARFQTGTFDTRSSLSNFPPRFYFNGTNISPFPLPNPAPPFTIVEDPFHTNISTTMERITGYLYDQWRPFEPLLLSGGVVYDYLQFPINFRDAPVAEGEKSEERISPKAGFTLTPPTDTVLRFAYTRSLGGVSFDQSVRLEPSQVAGFNQAFRSVIPESVAGSVAGAKFETFGVAVEQKFPTGTYLGAEGQIINSDAQQSVGVLEWAGAGLNRHTIPGQTLELLDYEEKDLLITLNQLVGQSWSIGGRYWLSQAELRTTFPEIPVTLTKSARSDNEATLHQLTLFALLNHHSGFFARAEAQWNMQNNSGYTPALAGDDFWQYNVFAGYRFFHRHAQIQFGVLNISDRDYNLNPLNLYSELPRRRTFTTSLQLTF